MPTNHSTARTNGYRRDEILAMIWDMEEEIMGRTEEAGA